MALYGLGLAADALAKSLAGLPESQAKTEAILPDFRNKIVEGQMAQEKLAEAKEAAPFRIPLLKSQIALRETESQKNLAEAAHKGLSSQLLGYKTTSDARGNTVTIDERPWSSTFGQAVAQSKGEPTPEDKLNENKLAEAERKNLAREMFMKEHNDQITRASSDPTHKYGIPEMANLMLNTGFIDDPKELFSALLGDERIKGMYERLALQEEMMRLKKEHAELSEGSKIHSIMTEAQRNADKAMSQAIPKHLVTGNWMYPKTTTTISIPAWNYMLEQAVANEYDKLMSYHPNKEKYPYQFKHPMPTQEQDPDFHKFQGTYVAPPSKSWGAPGTMSGAVVDATKNLFTPKAETKGEEAARTEKKAAVSNLGAISLRLSKGEQVSTDEVKAALKIAGVTDPFKVNQYINSLKTMYGTQKAEAPVNQLTPEENALKPEQFTPHNPARPRDELLGTPEVQFIMDSLEKKRATSAPAIRDLLRKSGWNQTDMDFLISWLQQVYGPSLVVTRGK